MFDPLPVRRKVSATLFGAVRSGGQREMLVH